MLSIIISSYQKEFYSALEKNIAETCGITYEIVKIENPGLMGISEAYNKGARRAKYAYLLFIHEDIQFKTQGWGDKLLLHFKLNNLGLIGVAGGEYVPTAPCGWFTSMKYASINICQRYRNGEKKIFKTFNEKSKKVLSIDGVFISIKKSLFLNYKFDENLSGFHGYDTELSLRVAQKHQNFVISDILIEHFSPGNPDKDWVDANIYIRKKLGSDYNKIIDKDIEYDKFMSLVIQYLNYYPKSFKNIRFIFQFLPVFKIKVNHYFNLVKFILRIYV